MRTEPLETLERTRRQESPPSVSEPSYPPWMRPLPAAATRNTLAQTAAAAAVAAGTTAAKTVTTPPRPCSHSTSSESSRSRSQSQSQSRLPPSPTAFPPSQTRDSPASRAPAASTTLDPSDWLVSAAPASASVSWPPARRLYRVHPGHPGHPGHPVALSFLLPLDPYRASSAPALDPQRPDSWRARSTSTAPGPTDPAAVSRSTRPTRLYPPCSLLQTCSAGGRRRTSSGLGSPSDAGDDAGDDCRGHRDTQEYVFLKGAGLLPRELWSGVPTKNESGSFLAKDRPPGGPRGDELTFVSETVERRAVPSTRHARPCGR